MTETQTDSVYRLPESRYDSDIAQQTNWVSQQFSLNESTTLVSHHIGIFIGLQRTCAHTFGNFVSEKNGQIGYSPSDFGALCPHEGIWIRHCTVVLSQTNVRYHKTI